MISVSADIYKGEISCSSSGVRQVAIKRFRCGNIPKDKIIKRLFQAAVPWKNLSHPHVMPLLDIASDLNGVPTVVVPYLPMGNILDYNRRNPNTDRTQQVFEIVLGLAYLHLNGVIHGNLTPSNVLINDDGTACITDIGLSHTASELGMMQQSPRYMAPELLHDGRLPVTSTSDVYSYGCVCYEIFTEQRSFDTISSEFDVILAVYNHELPSRPPSTHLTFSRGLDDCMWVLITKYWNASADKRPTAPTLCDSLAIMHMCLPTTQANKEDMQTRTEEIPAVDGPLRGLNTSSRL